ncbi:MAG: hypothetical protein GY832_22220 [Chloroflexi bacterium]|nr:hypothetical protein [Chloroflexota bacterium]
MTETTDTQTIEHIIPNAGLTAQKIAMVFKDKTVGDEVTDGQLYDACGEVTAPGGTAYGALQTAAKHFIKSNGVFWQRLRGQGIIRCMTAEEKMHYLKNETKRIGARARKNLRIGATVDIEELPEDKRPEARATLSCMGTMALCAKPQLQKKLAAKVKPAKPDVSALLAIMG